MEARERGPVGGEVGGGIEAEFPRQCRAAQHQLPHAHARVRRSAGIEARATEHVGGPRAIDGGRIVEGEVEKGVVAPAVRDGSPDESTAEREGAANRAVKRGRGMRGGKVRERGKDGTVIDCQLAQLGKDGCVCERKWSCLARISDGART